MVKLRDEWTDREVAEEFNKLCRNYHAGWLVKDTTAFEKFCFCHSERIAQILLKATDQ